jgi:uncharacterized repeat protein (TIGR01451 family)
MKKTLLFLLLFTGMTQAQIVNIPDINFKVKLISLGMDLNSDDEIETNEALAVTDLPVYNSNISSLTGIEAFTNLVTLNCGENSISTLNVNNLTHLESLICSYNNLTTLNVSNLINLRILYCQNNHLAQLNVSNLIHLTGLLCSTNNLTNLDISALANLDHLNCGYNMITIVDISNNPLICTFACNDMPQLNRLNLKNGSTLCMDSKILYHNPNLRFVCVDAGEALFFQNYFSTNSMPNVNVNTYCDFVPGGNFNTISGNIHFDSNGDGCDVNDNALSLVKFRISQGANDATTFSDLSGNYAFYTQTGNFTVAPEMENPSFFTVNPLNPIIGFANSDNNTSSQNFCVTANGAHADIEIVIVPIAPARPGFNAIYKIIYKNKGSQMLSGNIDFNYDDSVLDYVSTSVVPSDQNTGNINWNYSNLLPFESRSIVVQLNVNNQTETPAVNIGDVLNFSATINPISGDEMPVDNEFNYAQTVVGSFDPNNKECLEGDSVSTSKIGEYLHYVVNFENTGTASAQNVVVRDVIDTAKFDINSLQVLDTSHPVSTKVTGNKVEFIFQDINLAANAYGDVVFKIKSKSNLVNGDVVTNKADIFFDYNFPVATNLASTVFQTLGVDSFQLDGNVSICPNPSYDFVNIKSKSRIKLLQLFDVQGRLIETKIVNELNSKIDLSNNSKGVYFLKIEADNGVFSEKIIKE